jgi:hypothetical protein
MCWKTTSNKATRHSCHRAKSCRFVCSLPCHANTGLMHSSPDTHMHTHAYQHSTSIMRGICTRIISRHEKLLRKTHAYIHVYGFRQSNLELLQLQKLIEFTPSSTNSTYGNLERPGLTLAAAGLKPKHPVIMIPGIVTTGTQTAYVFSSSHCSTFKIIKGHKTAFNTSLLLPNVETKETDRELF